MLVVHEKSKAWKRRGRRIGLGLQPDSLFQASVLSGAMPACFETPILGGVNQALVPSCCSEHPQKTTSQRLRWA